MSLTLLDLMKIANKAYGDDGLAEYFDPKTGDTVRLEHQDKKGGWWAMIPQGDTLAAAICAEIHDSMVGDNLSDHSIVEGLIAQFDTALHDLQRVQEAFMDKLDQLEG